MPRWSAMARAAAMETARIAFAPSFALVGVPSSAIIALSSPRSSLQDDVGFDSGVSPRVQDFAGNNQLNLSHGMSPESLAGRFARVGGRRREQYETCNYTGAVSRYR